MSNLFTEYRINTIDIKNRIVMPPMVCFGMGNDAGLVTDAYVQHYEARAKGGAGLIIIEAACVNIKGRLASRQLGLWSDDQVAGFRRLAAACHRHGARVLAQIHHAGLATPRGITDDMVAPSDYQGVSRMGGRAIQARAMTEDEIHGLQADFVAAVVRAQQAGLDGVELHGAHGYLISQFFSPLINKRTDDYGGSAANRCRFAAEIIRGIRQATGDKFIVCCRMGGNEPDLAGGIENAKELERAGVDLLHVSTGLATLSGNAGDEPPVPDEFPYNSVVYCGTEIKKQVKVPVVVVNGIKTPEQADWLVERNLADFVAIGRGMLVDPEWANKAKKNLEVVPCIDCPTCGFFRPHGACPQVKRERQ